jgi:apolipoprotein N-acyltransferase
LIWTGFEFIHFRWSLSWPWLSFGHSLVKVVETIQWYEYTGVLGGTMWFLLAGHLLYKYISTKKRQLFILFTGIILIPLIISFSLLQLSWDQNVNEINVRIIHTNFYAQSEHNNTNYERIKLVTSHLKYKMT